jgi:hypothetical protein
MSPPDILAFLLIMLALAAMPSASVALVVARSATHGVPNGLPAAVGIVPGDLVFVALAGMTFLAPSSPTYYMTVCSLAETGPVPIFTMSIWARLPRHLELGCDLGVKTAAGDYCDVADWTGWNFMRRADLETEYGRQRGDAGI